MVPVTVDMGAEVGAKTELDREHGGEAPWTEERASVRFPGREDT